MYMTVCRGPRIRWAVSSLLAFLLHNALGILPTKSALWAYQGIPLLSALWVLVLKPYQKQFQGVWEGL